MQVSLYPHAGPLPYVPTARRGRWTPPAAPLGQNRQCGSHRDTGRALRRACVRVHETETCFALPCSPRSWRGLPAPLGTPVLGVGCLCTQETQRAGEACPSSACVMCVRVRAEHGLFPAGPYGLRESAVWGGAHGMLRIPQEQGAVTAVGWELGCRPPRPHSPAAEQGRCHQQGALWGSLWRRQLCHGSQLWGSLPRPAGPERSGLDSVPSWAHRPLSMQGLGAPRILVP